MAKLTALWACAITSLLIAITPAAMAAAPPYRNYVATWSPDGQWLAFYSNRDGNWEIYIVGSDGAGLRRLTVNAEYDGNPSWSPDGSKLVFDGRRAGERELFIADLKSGRTEPLTKTPDDEEQPSWSPTDNLVAYYRKTGEYYDLEILDVSTGGIRKLSTRLADGGRICWSGDGRQLIFLVRRADRPVVQIVNVDGSGERVLEIPIANAGNPCFSPDGQYVVFDAHAQGRAESGDGFWELWRMQLSDGTVERLTNNTVDDWGPRWSPDGARIAYVGGGLNNTGYEVMVLDLATGASQKVTTGADGTGAS